MYQADNRFDELRDAEEVLIKRFTVQNR